MMKTIKYILLILLLNSSILLMATTNQLYQTSSASYKSVGSGGVGSVGVAGTQIDAGSTSGHNADDHQHCQSKSKDLLHFLFLLKF